MTGVDFRPPYQLATIQLNNALKEANEARSTFTKE